MNITKHAIERWRERFIRSKNGDFSTYADEEIQEQMIKMFHKCKFVVDDERDGRRGSYYINPELDWLFVVDVNDNTIITCYDIDYGFSPEINKSITKGLIKEFDAVNKKIEVAKDVYEEKMVGLNHRRDLINEEIRGIKLKIKSLEEERNSINAEQDSLKSVLESLESDATRVAYQITHSKNFRMKELVRKSKRK